jgi:hypothetical protein
MDLDLLNRVAGQPVEPAMTEPAMIAGYRRTGIVGQRYPTLVRDPSSRVAGILVHGLNQRAAWRLAAYEGANYRLEPVSVADRVGRPTGAVVFLVVTALRSNRRHWRLDRWQRRWKRRAMRRAGRLKDSSGWARAFRRRS